VHAQRLRCGISHVAGVSLVVVIIVILIGGYAALNLGKTTSSLSQQLSTSSSSASTASVSRTSYTTSSEQIPASVENSVSTSTGSVTTSGSSGVQVSIQAGSAVNSTTTYYSPPMITVVIGINNTVTWTNNDNAPHSVTADDGSFDSGLLNEGQTWSYTFMTPGTYVYHCIIHLWMIGTVIVNG